MNRPTNNLSLEGALDVTTVSQLHGQFVEQLHDDRPLSLDMKDVTSIDASVIQLILASQKHADEQGKPFGMHHLPAPVERSLEASGALELLNQIQDET